MSGIADELADDEDQHCGDQQNSDYVPGRRRRPGLRNGLPDQDYSRVDDFQDHEADHDADDSSNEHGG